MVREHCTSGPSATQWPVIASISADARRSAINVRLQRSA
jgi:hypothetical protein